MALLMGPVLSFRGCDAAAQQWNLTALIVTDAAPGDLTPSGGPAVSPETLWQVGSRTAYRYTFSFPMQVKASTATYRVLNKSYEVAVPGVGKPPTMAYASCNGFSEPGLSADDKNALWKSMAKRHKKLAYHLLLLGGDQVYADEMLWREGSLMRNWHQQSWDEGNDASAPPAMQKELREFYFDLYTARWSQPEVAEMLARVPNVAMWDDHDLYDGWGSYPKERQNCEVHDAVWANGAKAFAVFQQQIKDNERRPGAIGNAPVDWWAQTAKQANRKGAFSYSYVVGGIALLVLDLRSQRTAETQIIGNKHWKEIYSWIEALDRNQVSHLVVLSSIPVVYPDFQMAEDVLGFFPGHQDLEDDIRDHWTSPPHKGERIRLIKNLLELPKKKIRTTLVSGDVHIAALGVLQNTGEASSGPETTINQLISSGIVHPGPGAFALIGIKLLFDRDEQIDPYTVAKMIDVPYGKRKFIGKRNYLSIEPDQKSDQLNLWCHWLVENDDGQFTQVIHSLSPSTG